jgi:thiosulfate/3-mercaptopyruvate sulfurtransferase
VCELNSLACRRSRRRLRKSGRQRPRLQPAPELVAKRQAQRLDRGLRPRYGRSRDGGERIERIGQGERMSLRDERAKACPRQPCARVGFSINGETIITLTAASSMAFKTLISTDLLAARLADPSFVVVDCRFKLDDVAWGEARWRAGHIPGAAYAHLDRDLSGPQTGTNGRHPLPDVALLSETFSRYGVTNGKQVVAYDQDNGVFASRLWWLLRWLGHDAVAVLDGGFAKWVAEGRPVSTDAEPLAVAEFHAAPRQDMTIDIADVAAHARDADWRLLDARAPERFRGEVEPIDPVAGHIPGAKSYFFQRNIDERGILRTPEDLRARFASYINGIVPEHIVSYCGSGVQACHNLLALEHAGVSGAKLYPGSWSEWVSDRSRPVETVS